MKTHYDVLGVTADVTDAELKAAWRKAVRAAHPDTGGTAAAFQAVQDAYACLSDPVARAAYDRLLALGEAAPTHDDPPAGAPSTWGTTSTVPAGPPHAPAHGPVTPPHGVKVPGQYPTRPWNRIRWVATSAVLAVWYLLAAQSGHNLPTLVWVIGVASALVRALAGSRAALTALWVAAAVATLEAVLDRGNWWLAGAAACALAVTQAVDAAGWQGRLDRITRAARRVADRVVPSRRRHRTDTAGEAWEHVRRLARSGHTVWFVVQADAAGTGTMAATATILAPVHGGPHTLKLLDGIHVAGTWVVLDRTGQVVFTTTEDARKAWQARTRR